MATPPTFIQEAETAYGSSTSPKTTAGFDVVAGDVLVAFAAMSDCPPEVYIENSGAPLGWSQLVPVNVFGRTFVSMWCAPVEADATGLTVSFVASTTNWFGGSALTWRDCAGMGAYTKADYNGAAPTLDIATRYNNSAVVVVNSDWNAIDGTSRAWRTGAGAVTETTYFRADGFYTVYAGYHADAGNAGTKTVGLTTPVQRYSIVALELVSADERPETLVLTKAR